VNDGGPAFPRMTPSAAIEYPGMSMRDYFMAAVVQGMCAGTDWGSGRSVNGPGMIAAAAELADAMLAERSRT